MSPRERASGTSDPPRSIWQRPAPTESPRANSRRALVEAAFGEFSDKGYDAATVAGIAERAGVTTGALYAHFRGKLDLLLEVLGMAPVDDVMRSIAGLAARPWVETSRFLSEGMANRPDARTLLLLDVIVVARRDPELAETLRTGLETYLHVIKTATDAGRDLGVVDPVLGTDDLARVLSLMSMGMVVFGAVGEPPPSVEAFGRVVDLLLQAVPDDGLEGTAPVLTRVRARAAALERGKRSLHAAIVEAVEVGHTLRQVGEAAGISHERVRQVLRAHAQAHAGSSAH